MSLVGINIRATVLLWAHAFVSALLVSWPFARVISLTSGANPGGEMALFEAGSLPLFELVTRQAAAFAVLGASATLAFFLSLLLGSVLVPMALESVRTEGEGLAHSELARSALRSWWKLLAVQLLFAVLAGAGLCLAYGVSRVLRTLGHTDRAIDLWSLGAIPVALALWALTQILCDLARIAVLRGDPAKRALRFAWQQYRTAPIRLLVSYTLRALVTFALVAGLWLSVKWSLAMPVAVAWVAHQGVALILAAIRASWFARVQRASLT